MTIEELIEKFRFALTFLGITGGESMTIALKRESLEQVIAILEEYRQMKEKQVPKYCGKEYTCIRKVKASQLLFAVSALADMVYQFGYDTSFRRKESVYDGGLSALEKAFIALTECGCNMNSNGTITRENLEEFERQMRKKSDEIYDELG